MSIDSKGNIVDFNPGVIHAEHELSEMLTPFGMFALKCKDAANLARPEEARKKSLVLANAYLDVAAVEVAFGKVDFNTFLRAIKHPKTQEEKRKLLDEYRVDKRDPQLGEAINALYPSTHQNQESTKKQL